MRTSGNLIESDSPMFIHTSVSLCYNANVPSDIPQNSADFYHVIIPIPNSHY